MPASIHDLVWQILQPAINLGLEEEKFWEMTIAEIDRWMGGANWRLRTQAQFDYVLADLVGISVSRIFSKEAQFPSIDQAYPELFKGVVEKKEPEDDLTTKSVNNFLARAMAINAAKRHSKEDSGGEQL